MVLVWIINILTENLLNLSIIFWWNSSIFAVEWIFLCCDGVSVNNTKLIQGNFLIEKNAKQQHCVKFMRNLCCINTFDVYEHACWYAFAWSQVKIIIAKIKE